jgi:hypothetical protein
MIGKGKQREEEEKKRRRVIIYYKITKYYKHTL